MEELLFNSEHYWVSLDGDIATVGLSSFFLDAFEEISYVDLTEIGFICNKTDVIGTISADGEEIEIDSLFTGEIIEINEVLLDEPMNIKSSSIEINWLYKITITDSNELGELFTREEYEEFLENNM